MDGLQVFQVIVGIATMIAAVANVILLFRKTSAIETKLAQLTLNESAIVSATGGNNAVGESIATGEINVRAGGNAKVRTETKVIG